MTKREESYLENVVVVELYQIESYSLRIKTTMFA